ALDGRRPVRQPEAARRGDGLRPVRPGGGCAAARRTRFRIGTGGRGWRPRSHAVVSCRAHEGGGMALPRRILPLIALGMGLVLLAACSGKVKRVSPPADRKSTRLNSSHVKISYAVFC